MKEASLRKRTCAWGVRDAVGLAAQPPSLQQIHLRDGHQHTALCDVRPRVVYAPRVCHVQLLCVFQTRGASSSRWTTGCSPSIANRWPNARIQSDDGHVHTYSSSTGVPTLELTRVRSHKGKNRLCCVPRAAPHAPPMESASMTNDHVGGWPAGADSGRASAVFVLLLRCAQSHPSQRLAQVEIERESVCVFVLSWLLPKRRSCSYATCCVHPRPGAGRGLLEWRGGCSSLILARSIHYSQCFREPRSIFAVLDVE